MFQEQNKLHQLFQLFDMPIASDGENCKKTPIFCKTTIWSTKSRETYMQAEPQITKQHANIAAVKQLQYMGNLQ